MWLPPGPGLPRTSPSSGSECSNANSKTRLALFDAHWVLPVAAFSDKTRTPDFKMLLNLSRNGMTKAGRVVHRERSAIVVNCWPHVLAPRLSTP
jgi:hypothetical protein